MGYTPPWLNVLKTSGLITLHPGGVTTDDLLILPNAVDAKAFIKLYGGGQLQLTFDSATSLDICYDAGTSLFKIAYTANGPNLFPSVADKDLCLSPSGTGRIRYGTYVVGSATDSTGYIEIKDSGGTTRKLMVQA